MGLGNINKVWTMKELIMEKTEWYLEYEIQYNRPGLLGDISSLLGMLSINIITINAINEVENSKRVLLLLAKHDEQIIDRKSTRLNSSHVAISYAVFCLK